MGGDESGVVAALVAALTRYCGGTVEVDPDGTVL